jgi:hypothetical protein
MLRRLRENGPAVLVPLAWSFAAAAHLGTVSTRTALIAHVVMTVLLAAFAGLSWRDMDSGILRTWRNVVAVGFVVTLVGTVGIAWSLPPALLAATVLAWMLVPGVGLLLTGNAAEAEADADPRPYAGGGALSVLAAGFYAWWFLTDGATATLVLSMGLVGVGQTVGIVDAVLRY